MYALILKCLLSEIVMKTGTKFLIAAGVVAVVTTAFVAPDVYAQALDATKFTVAAKDGVFDQAAISVKALGVAALALLASIAAIKWIRGVL